MHPSQARSPQFRRSEASLRCCERARHRVGTESRIPRRQFDPGYDRSVDSCPPGRAPLPRTAHLPDARNRGTEAAPSGAPRGFGARRPADVTRVGAFRHDRGADGGHCGPARRRSRGPWRPSRLSGARRRDVGRSPHRAHASAIAGRAPPRPPARERASGRAGRSTAWCADLISSRASPSPRTHPGARTSLVGDARIRPVSNAADRILHDALGLSDKERAEIAARLIESLDADTGADADEIEEAWAVEIERRCAKLDAGTSGTSAWDDVRRKIEADIRRR